MIFSKRLKLQEKFEKWRISTKEETGLMPKNCAMSVITFLLKEGLIVENYDNTQLTKRKVNYENTNGDSSS